MCNLEKCSFAALVGRVMQTNLGFMNQVQLPKLINQSVPVLGLHGKVLVKRGCMEGFSEQSSVLPHIRAEPLQLLREGPVAAGPEI